MAICAAICDIKLRPKILASYIYICVIRICIKFVLNY